jgi:DNA polymerase III epsilon subunit-like protein
MPRPPMNECKLFFFDCETGGLDPHTSDMLEVACIVTDPSGVIVEREYCKKVFPKKPVDPGAAKVNGYEPAIWEKEAIDIDQAMVEMLAMAKDAVFVSHNATFDWPFFEMAMRNRGAKWPGDYHRLCTVTMASPMIRAGILTNVKLVDLTKHFEIQHANAHTALADVRACREVFLKLSAIADPAFQTYKEATCKIANLG